MHIYTHTVLHTGAHAYTWHTIPLHFHTYPQTPTQDPHAYLLLPGQVPCLQLWLILPSAMAFSELMDRVGSKGPFQFLNLVLLGLPVLNLANHNLLQIFTATTPAHHCRQPPNASEGPWVLPKDRNGKPEMCLRFIHLPNASLPNNTQGATEPCLDGWVYDLSTTSSIVTEVCPKTPLLPPPPDAPPYPAMLGGRGTGWALVSRGLGLESRALDRPRGRTWCRCRQTRKLDFFTELQAFLQHCAKHGAKR